jgi:hypothetical protein
MDRHISSIMNLYWKPVSGECKSLHAITGKHYRLVIIRAKCNCQIVPAADLIKPFLKVG